MAGPSTDQITPPTEAPVAPSAAAAPVQPAAPANASPAAAAPTPSEPPKAAPIIIPNAPAIVLGTNLTMPGLPVTNNGQPIPSVLGSEDVRKKSFDHFMKMWDEAGKLEPKLGGDPAAFLAARDRFHANPLLSFRKQIEEDYKANAAQNPEDAKKMYEFQVQQLANQYMNGMDRGAEDPSVNASRQGAFQQLLGGDMIGAIKTFALTIPFIGDFVAAAGKWVMSRFNNNPLTFAESQEAIKLEKAYGGAAAAIGLKDQSAGNLVAEGRGYFMPPKNAPTTSAGPSIIVVGPKPDIELDAGFNTPENTANAKVAELIKSGDIKIEGSDKVLATQKAVAELDALSANPVNTPAGSPALTGKQGESWATSK